MAGFLNSRKKKVIKRGGRKINKSKSNSFNIYSTNSAGLKNKLPSFKNQIKTLDAAIFTLQETPFGRKGSLKMEEYEIFEAIRAKKSGGTLMECIKL